MLVAGLSVFLFPPAGLAEHLPFAIISDTHVGHKNSVYPALMRILDSHNIRVIIHAGDAIHDRGDHDQWSKFIDMTGTEKILHLAAGNHDVRGKDSFETYRRYFPSNYHSWTEGDTLFVLLNTEMPGEEFRVAGEQLEWLEDELKKPFRYKFVFLHKPLFPFLFRQGLDRHRASRNALHKLFVRRGVSLVVAGHDHVYRRMTKDGITYVVNGGAGGRIPPFYSKDGSSFSYIVTSKTFDDGYSFVVRDLRGKARDVFWVVR